MAGSDTTGHSASGFDSILSNPPFLNQLRSRTALDRGLAGIVKVNSGGRTSAYTDSAAVFLDMAFDLTQPGGTVAMLLPQSVLASRDAQRIRDRAVQLASLEHIWVSDRHAFDDALVSTWAPVVRLDTEQGMVTQTHADMLEDKRPLELSRGELASRPTWAFLTSAARGVPTFEMRIAGTVGELATATADFRDEYYRLEGLIEETPPNGQTASNQTPIITTGLIDPAVCYWGEQPTRIHKKRWQKPCIDTSATDSSSPLGIWLTRRLVPKVLLATQTRVLEVFVDDAGRYAPCLPLISVYPKDTSEIWHLACLLGSPVLTAISLDRYAGTAMTTDAIKLAAKQVLDLPLPQPEPAWDEAAEAFKLAQHAESEQDHLYWLQRSGKLMCDCFGLSQDDSEKLMAWWTPRLPESRFKKTAPA